MYSNGFISVNSVPTKVATYGKWIEDNLEEVKQLILIIPGNPGSCDFYGDFQRFLYKNTSLSNWTISHAGHAEPKGIPMKVPKLKGNESLYSLEGQIQHKVTFIETYIPQDVEIILIGHSIGAKICMEIMKRLGHRYQFGRSYLLFPLIERMKETPAGRQWQMISKYFRCLVMALIFIVLLLPKAVKRELFKLFVYDFINASKSVENALLNLCQSHKIARCILHLTYDELIQVRALDIDTFQRFHDKLLVYYGASDRWCPTQHCHDLKTRFPNCKAILCEKGIIHAFILKESDSEIMGNMVSEWIGGERREIS